MQMIACDNEGGCPFEWVSLDLHALLRLKMLISLMIVPSFLRGHEAAYTRKMVLLRMCSGFEQEGHSCIY